MGVVANGDFELTLDELRLVAQFGAESAQDVLPLFERSRPDDPRPRAALDAAWEFINGARRTNRLRVTSTDAHRAAKETPDEVARLAAQGAGDAAAAAYLHPIAKAHQVGHIWLFGHLVGSWGEASCGEEHAEAVVVQVAVAAGEAAVEFDDAVDGFGAAVVRAAGGEVGQERVAPAA